MRRWIPILQKKDNLNYSKVKKIMFNDRYGLTKAVLDGYKTMTRRVIPELMSIKDPDISEWGIDDKGKAYICLYEGGRPTTDIYPAYQPGELVAVAQPYYEVWEDPFTAEECLADELDPEFLRFEAGWNNKMFVKAAYMPHIIQISDIKVERLQEISDSDCFGEGIRWDYADYPYMNEKTYYYTDYEGFDTLQRAFASLINRVSGKSTWESNPFVFVYSFKLIR